MSPRKAVTIARQARSAGYRSHRAESAMRQAARAKIDRSGTWPTVMLRGRRTDGCLVTFKPDGQALFRYVDRPRDRFLGRLLVVAVGLAIVLLTRAL